MPTVLKSGSLNLLEPSGPVQVCNGIALPLPYEKEKGRPILCLYIHEEEVANKASTHLKPSTRKRKVVRTTLRHLTPRQTQFHCTGGWLILGVGLEGTERLTPLGFEPQPAQPVTSCYTDCATPAAI